jgi:tripartite-type tricarboxylate transporter receptor subunit TctC
MLDFGGLRTNICFAALCISAMSPSANADSVSDFYSGKTVKIVVATQAGTGFDLYARTLAQHMGRLLPGNPIFVVQNMPGASGLTAANWMANVAPKDGTVLATIPFTVPFEPLLEEGKGRFDAPRLTWIGNMDTSVSICTVSTKLGLKSFDDVMQREVLVGGTGRSGPLAQVPKALARLTGAKLKVIDGYKGSAAVKLAVQRGEVHGVCGISFSTVRTRYADVHSSGEMKMILQVGPEPHPDLKELKHVYEYAKSDEERQVFDLIFGTQGLGRSYVAATGIPADRTAALRKAFMATMSDTQFLADARKAKLDLRPQSGEAVEAFVKRLYASPKKVVERAKAVFRE